MNSVNTKNNGRKSTLSLHLGAHKTASSHLQQSLRDNRVFLNGINTKFVPTLSYREEFAPIEESLRDGKGVGTDLENSFQKKLETYQKDMHRIILSEENILVLSKPILGDELYPAAIDRIRRTRQLIGKRNIRVFIAVRSYPEFLSSLYIEHLRHFEFKCKHEFLAGMNYGVEKWTVFLEKIRGALEGDDEMFVWTYESYCKNPDPILEALLQCKEVSKLKLKPKHVRKSPPKNAVDYLLRKAKRENTKYAKSIFSSEAFCKLESDGGEKFSLFSKLEKRSLNDVYKAEVERMHEAKGYNFIC